PPPPMSPLFPYTTLFRSEPGFHEKSVAVLTHELLTAQMYGAAFLNVHIGSHRGAGSDAGVEQIATTVVRAFEAVGDEAPDPILRSEEHTSELQSPYDLVC